MSKASDNEVLAGLVQRTAQAKGFYTGEIDEWGGPATQTAFRAMLGLDRVPAPPILVPEPDLSGMPKPAALYKLPSEAPSELNAFYGVASGSPDYLDWFSFPHESTRLYTRTGTLLVDRVGDDRVDHKCHKFLVGRLQAALAEIYVTLGRVEFERQGWHIYGGCHDYRKKRGGSSLSIHSWGIGIDINPNENAYASTKTTFSDVAINIMEKWGFLSGFRAWGKDAMHFQAAIPNLSPGSFYARNGFPKNIARL